MFTDEINRWLISTLEHPKNLASESELKEQINVAIRAFNLSDIDQSGNLTTDEICKLCDQMGLPISKDDDNFIELLDKDDSGGVELGEWVTWWLKRVSALPNPLKQQEAIARNVFKKFDIDNSSFMDAREFNLVLAELGANFNEKDLNEALEILDSDCSGNISEKEFLDWWTDRISKNRKKGGLVMLKLKKLATRASQIFFTDIFSATWKNDLDLVKIFLKSDRRMSVACDESEYGDGWTALHYASYQGYIDIVHELLKSGAGVNICNNNGFTALFYSAQQGHIAVCRLLLDSNADYLICGNETVGGSEVVMGPLEHAVDNPALMTLFKSLDVKGPPEQIPSDKIIAKLDCNVNGLLTIALPSQKTYSSLPVKHFLIELSLSCIDSTEVLLCNITIAAKNRSSNPQDVSSSVLDRQWLKRLNSCVSRGTAQRLTVAITAVDMLRQAGITSAANEVEMLLSKAAATAI